MSQSVQKIKKDQSQGLFGVSNAGGVTQETTLHGDK